MTSSKTRVGTMNTGTNTMKTDAGGMWGIAMRKTWAGGRLAGALVAGLVASTALASGCGGEEPSTDVIIRPVRWVVAGNGTGDATHTFAGSVRAGSESRLSFQVPGRVTTLSVRVGDAVEADQVIAEVDPTDLQLQLQEARASAGQAQAQSRSAAATYQRVRALYENQNASPQDLDNARAQRDGAQSAAGAAGQAVRRLQRQLEYARLSAPSAGTISAVSVEAGEVVGAGQVVATLQIGEQLEVGVDMPESHIQHVARGDEAQVQIRGRSIVGTVYEVGTPAQGSAIFPVTIRLPEGTEDVRPGMVADVSFHVDAEVEAPGLTVPTSAVGEDREGRFVFVLDGDGETAHVRRRSVEVGEIGPGGIVVTEGLEAGERVVTAGVSRIEDGLEVRVPPQEGAASDEDAEAPAETQGDDE
jgi:RND family efflux transporter MFP subunit